MQHDCNLLSMLICCDWNEAKDNVHLEVHSDLVIVENNLFYFIFLIFFFWFFYAVNLFFGHT